MGLPGLEKSIGPERLVKIPRPCQHQCPIVLVHEAKRTHQQLHRHNQPLPEAVRVHEEQLLPSPHTHLARTVRATVDCHKVDAGVVGRQKGDAGGQLGDVVHCLPHPFPQFPGDSLY